MVPNRTHTCTNIWDRLSHVRLGLVVRLCVTDLNCSRSWRWEHESALDPKDFGTPTLYLALHARHARVHHIALGPLGARRSLSPDQRSSIWLVKPYGLGTRMQRA